jgi:hypothetical protein
MDSVTRFFFMRFLPSEHVPQPPDSYPKAVSKIIQMARYSNSKSMNWRGPSRKIRLSNVALFPRDRFLRCGPPRGIESNSVAPRGIESCKVASPVVSHLSVWPTSGYRFFFFGPSRGTGSYGVAPPWDRLSCKLKNTSGPS